jgi:arylsulfatase A-like enzyme
VGWGHAVRHGKWKAVSFYADEPFELYDLSVDLGETRDVAAHHADVIADLTAFAKAAHIDNPLFPVQNCSASAESADW